MVQKLGFEPPSGTPVMVVNIPYGYRIGKFCCFDQRHNYIMVRYDHETWENPVHARPDKVVTASGVCLVTGQPTKDETIMSWVNQRRDNQRRDDHTQTTGYDATSQCGVTTYALTLRGHNAADKRTHHLRKFVNAPDYQALVKFIAGSGLFGELAGMPVVSDLRGHGSVDVVLGTSGQVTQFVNVSPTRWPAEVQDVAKLVPLSELRISVDLDLELCGSPPDDSLIVDLLRNKLVGTVIDGPVTLTIADVH